MTARVGAAPAKAARRRPRIDRGARLVEVWLRSHTGLVFLFLYLPILIVIVYAFNGTTRRVTLWGGFSTKWFTAALGDEVVRKALINSFIIALPNAVMATAFGGAAALGLQRVGRRTRIIFDALTYLSVIVPEIVIALATLILFATGFDAVEGAFGIKLRFGHATIIAAHVLFNTSLVLLLVRARLTTMDRTHVEASYDLFAPPWPTFRQITLPQLLPALVAGFLLSFTFSFDDYVITTFTSGPGATTLPLFIFGQIKRGVTPETNAVATMMLALTLALLALGQWILTRQTRRQGGTSVAGIIVEQG